MKTDAWVASGRGPYPATFELDEAEAYERIVKPCTKLTINLSRMIQTCHDAALGDGAISLKMLFDIVRASVSGEP